MMSLFKTNITIYDFKDIVKDRAYMPLWLHEMVKNKTAFIENNETEYTKVIIKTLVGNIIVHIGDYIIYGNKTGSIFVLVGKRKILA